MKYVQCLILEPPAFPVNSLSLCPALSSSCFRGTFAYAPSYSRWVSVVESQLNMLFCRTVTFIIMFFCYDSR